MPSYSLFYDAPACLNCAVQLKSTTPFLPPLGGRSPLSDLLNNVLRDTTQKANSCSIHEQENNEVEHEAAGRATVVADSLVLSLLVVALTPSAGFADAVKATPWLAGVTTNSVYACLEADTTADATVEFGLTTGYGSSASTESADGTTNSTYVHNVRLTDLQPCSASR